MGIRELNIHDIKLTSLKEEDCSLYVVYQEIIILKQMRRGVFQYYRLEHTVDTKRNPNYLYTFINIATGDYHSIGELTALSVVKIILDSIDWVYIWDTVGTVEDAINQLKMMEELTS